MTTIRHTERTYYAPLMKILEEDLGAPGAQEESIIAGSNPDILFDYFGKEWILSVKMGDPTATITQSAWHQFVRHKGESRRDHGMILVIDEKITKQPRTKGSELTKEVRKALCAVLIDVPIGHLTGATKTTFPEILKLLRQNIIPQLKTKAKTQYTLADVERHLQMQVQELMERANLSNKRLRNVIYDNELLSSIGKFNPKTAMQVAQFLAAYIIISQIIFLILYSKTRPKIYQQKPKLITKKWLRDCFKRIRKVNYEKIYEIDVLDALDEEYLRSTFQLLSGLNIEQHRLDLPGRLFHKLMNHDIRKLLAAFYTRPRAAELLARLTISRSEDTVIDPACGSGTILVQAYKRKEELALQEGKHGSHHVQFCEKDIWGSEIMPFGVHLTTANLASLEPQTELHETRISEGDSLKTLQTGHHVRSGLRQVSMELFEPVTDPNDPSSSVWEQKPDGKQISTMKIDGGISKTTLPRFDIVLMNPPFTRKERGKIQKLVDMKRFVPFCGEQADLWGHFLGLADELLKENGVLGTVIPISILRGTRGEQIKKWIWNNWTPMYIIKPTINYAFSENAEFRDVLLIAKKRKPKPTDEVKVVLIKKFLSDLDDADISHFGDLIESNKKLDDVNIDIETFTVKEFKERIDNQMWFINLSEAKARRKLVSFTKKFTGKLVQPPLAIFSEGYDPRPEGAAKWMFLTRAFQGSRLEKAFLRFTNDGLQVSNKRMIQTTYGNAGASFDLSWEDFSPCLRTHVGHSTMSIPSSRLDYVAKSPYKHLNAVMNACAFDKTLFRTGKRTGKDWWAGYRQKISSLSTNLTLVQKVGPTSPDQHFYCFYSTTKFTPSKMFMTVTMPDDQAKAFCCVVNSIIFLAQFFLLKEDTGGRLNNLRQHDYAEYMIKCDDPPTIKKLVTVFKKYSSRQFKASRFQLDTTFNYRKEYFWYPYRPTLQKNKRGKKPSKVKPTNNRIDFDYDVCKALGMNVTKKYLQELYAPIINQMVTLQGLSKHD